MQTFLYLFSGLFLLFAGGHFLVIYSVQLARKLSIPKIVIGSTIVAFGTSAPELVVSADAILNEHYKLVLGNIIGSNIANILLALSIAALIYPIKVQSQIVKYEGAVMLAATFVFIALCLTGQISSLQGLFLLALLFLFLFSSFFFNKKSLEVLAEQQIDPIDLNTGEKTISFYLLWITGALLALAFGSHYFVKGAVQLGQMIGIPELVVGLTVVAISTSAPEVVSSGIAAYHKHSDIALGNVIGSNIFNLLAISGVTSLISPIKINIEILKGDLIVLTVVSVGIIAYAYFIDYIGRVVGAVLLLIYIAYNISLYL